MSVRKGFAAEVQSAWSAIPDLAEVRVVATERGLDDIKVPTALIRQKSIGKSPELPNSHRTVGLLLTLISPLTNLDLAGDQLDVLVEAALDYLDTGVAVRHEDAEAVGYDNRLAYDIPLTILAEKE